MDSQSLQEQCLQVVQALADEQKWSLPAYGLVEAILPFLQDTIEPTVQLIRAVAFNYSVDGPMYQQMLSDSARGEQLWTEWQTYMLKVAIAKGLTPEDAEDLVQTLFIHTRKALQTFKFNSRLKTYFYSIFNRQYAKWLQKHTKIKQIPLEDGDSEQAVLVEINPTEQVENAEIRRLIKGEIQKILNSEDYQILYWYYVEQTTLDPATGKEKKWTDKAIGDQLGMPLNTVTSRRMRALDRLRQNSRLAEWFQELLNMGSREK